MTKNNALEVGKEIGIETDEGQTFNGKLKRIKGPLIAVSLTSGLKNKTVLANGALLRILTKDHGAQPLLAVVKQDKAFPLLILSLEAEERKKEPLMDLEEKEDIEDLISSITDSSYVKQRDSARIEDSFPIEIYKQSHKRAEEKKNDYLIRPTNQRRESFKVGKSAPMQGVNEQELKDKIAHLDSALQNIIMDLYARVAALSQKDPPPQPETSDDDSIGSCVDISGTGFRILTSQLLKRGDILKTILAPPLASPPFSVSCLVEVMRVTMVKNTDNPNLKYAVGVKYYAINEEDMEQIVRYTFKLQRDYLQMQRQLKFG